MVLYQPPLGPDFHFSQPRSIRYFCGSGREFWSYLSWNYVCFRVSLGQEVAMTMRDNRIQLITYGDWCGGEGRTLKLWADVRGRRSASQEKTTRSAYMGMRLLSIWGGSWTGQTTTDRRSFGTSGRQVGSRTGWGRCSGGRDQGHKCLPCFIKRWSR